MQPSNLQQRRSHVGFTRHRNLKGDLPLAIRHLQGLYPQQKPALESLVQAGFLDDLPRQHMAGTDALGAIDEMAQVINAGYRGAPSDVKGGNSSNQARQDPGFRRRSPGPAPWRSPR